MLIRLTALLALVFTCLSGPALAQTPTVTFTGLATEVPNPERGWWTYAGGSFRDFTDARAAKIAKDGFRITLGVVRLDDYRDGPIPQSALTSLDKSFEHARKHGLKVIVRFAYNFPLNASDPSADAPLNTVLGHIRQIGPIITANADTIVAMQAGFIGKWGELHSSTNDLTTPANKARIRDALYAALPKSLNLQWRYPADIISWTGDSRMGLHNDCFLSSDTDVGTYSGNAATRATQRTAMKALTGQTFFSGETCSAKLSEARLACSAILAEGAEFHVASLNRNYYTGFHDRWKSEGCFETVSRKQGYDLRLVDLTLSRRGGITLRIANDGWARPIQPRPVVISYYRGGTLVGSVSLKEKLNMALPAKVTPFTGTQPRLPRGVDRICISAPDSSMRLAKLPAYAIRFANGDRRGQSWNAGLSAFCFTPARR